MQHPSVINGKTFAQLDVHLLSCWILQPSQKLLEVTSKRKRLQHDFLLAFQASHCVPGEFLAHELGM